MVSVEFNRFPILTLFRRRAEVDVLVCFAQRDCSTKMQLMLVSSKSESLLRIRRVSFILIPSRYIECKLSMLVLPRP